MHRGLSLDPSLTCTKLKAKWAKVLHVKTQALSLPGDKIGKTRRCRHREAQNLGGIKSNARTNEWRHSESKRFVQQRKRPIVKRLPAEEGEIFCSTESYTGAEVFAWFVLYEKLK